MAINNQLAKQNTKPSFGVMINSDGYKRMINQTLGDPKKAARFVTAITSAVSTNPALKNCDAATIVSAGLLGETLNLSPSPQLGQYYLVPYEDKKNERTVAQFQLGYKGLLMLAQRSGEYKRINAMPVKEGELLRYDPFNDEIELQYIDDEERRESLPTIGYYAMFEYHNGFRKVLFWNKAKMQAHAEKYSKAYAGDVKRGTAYTFWSKDFDAMATKTMLRQLISKWGLLSVEMQKGLGADQGVVNQDGTVDYIDAPSAGDSDSIIDVAPSESAKSAAPAAQKAPSDEHDIDDFAALMEG